MNRPGEHLTTAELVDRADTRAMKVLDMYESGKTIAELAIYWDVSKVRIYQILRRARRLRASDQP